MIFLYDLKSKEWISWFRCQKISKHFKSDEWILWSRFQNISGDIKNISKAMNGYLGPDVKIFQEISKIF